LGHKILGQIGFSVFDVNLIQTDKTYLALFNPFKALVRWKNGLKINIHHVVLNGLEKSNRKKESGGGGGS